MAEYYSKHTGQEIDDAVDAMLEAGNKYVSVTEQTFTDEQKVQARENIGAEQEAFIVKITSTTTDGTTIYEADKTAMDIYNAANSGKMVLAYFGYRTLSLYGIQNNGTALDALFGNAHGVNSTAITIRTIISTGRNSVIFSTISLRNSNVAVPVNGGGTGKKELTAGSYLVGNGTGAVSLKTPDEVMKDLMTGRTVPETDFTIDTSYFGLANSVLDLNESAVLMYGGGVDIDPSCLIFFDGNTGDFIAIGERGELIAKPMTAENWIFTLEDGSTVTKKVHVG